MADDHVEFLRRGHEAKDLDYKGPMDWDESSNRAGSCGLVKDILGMANAGGGYIVIGVSEGPGGFVLEGLTDQQVRSFETTRLNRFVQNYADPPINTSLAKLEHDGKRFVIIGVPAFAETPHICQKDFPGVLSASTLYVRTANNETAPLKSSADFRAIVERAVRNRSDELLAAVRAVMMGSLGAALPSNEERFETQLREAIAEAEEVNPFREKNYTGYREATFHPAQFNAERFTLAELRAAAERASVDFRGWPFLFISQSTPDLVTAIQDGLQAEIPEQDFQLNDRFDFWRLQQSGFFYQRVLMWEESYQRRSEEPNPVLDVNALIAYAGEAITCLTNLYDGLLEDGEEVSLRLRLLGTRERTLVLTDRGRLPLSRRYTARTPEVVYARSMTLAEWRAGVIDWSVDVARHVFERFNWERPNLGAARDLVTKMLGRRL